MTSAKNGARKDIIVIGGSAGGVEALKRLVKDIPRDINATIFVVIHFPPESTSILPNILENIGNLPAAHAQDGEHFRRGHIYVAQPDHHLILERGIMKLTRGPRENRNRPAIDLLFRSAALMYGPRVIGILLTGTLDDGSAGFRAIKARGGTLIVQDPVEAMYPDMVRNAMKYVKVDHILPLAEMSSQLSRISEEEAGAAPPIPEKLKLEVEIAESEMSEEKDLRKIGTPSTFACPECHGTLWEIQDGVLLRFRCRIGHAYTAETMLAVHGDSLEQALWAALRTLEEKAELLGRLALQAHERNAGAIGERFEARQKEVSKHVKTLHNVVKQLGTSNNEGDLKTKRTRPERTEVGSNGQRRSKRSSKTL